MTRGFGVKQQLQAEKANIVQAEKELSELPAEYQKVIKRRQFQQYKIDQEKQGNKLASDEAPIPRDLAVTGSASSGNLGIVYDDEHSGRKEVLEQKLSTSKDRVGQLQKLLKLLSSVTSPEEEPLLHNALCGYTSLGTQMVGLTRMLDDLQFYCTVI
jgi:hypothetical protein